MTSLRISLNPQLAPFINQTALGHCNKQPNIMTMNNRYQTTLLSPTLTSNMKIQQDQHRQEEKMPVISRTHSSPEYNSLPCPAPAFKSRLPRPISTTTEFVDADGDEGLASDSDGHSPRLSLHSVSTFPLLLTLQLQVEIITLTAPSCFISRTSPASGPYHLTMSYPLPTQLRAR